MQWQAQPMLRPRIEKVVVNISVGKSGEPLEKATRVLKDLTGQTPCKRKAKESIRDFNIRKGESIACIVTLRGEDAIAFLNRVLPVIDKKISSRSFDRQGNFSFGIKEHIEISGVKYVPEVGIFGMDVCVSVTRPGYRVKIRRDENKIGAKHVLTPEESMAFVKNTLGVEIV
ncbi:50S ribosomal protein L5 [Candidatus Bathyarchaeota archaeon RBG_13_46_16b]|nr:MAG: 50S ribosomal protein L5 [Candidatus Bathyarchaeota archaeon RBG_13_46_16b]HJW98038.1 50S ribosomal protein L5 [Candidatus Bathyarchaeia archaeon]